MVVQNTTTGELCPQSPPLYLGINFPGINIAAGRNLGFTVNRNLEDPIEAQHVQNLRGKLGLSDEEMLHVVNLTFEGLEPKNLRPRFQTPLVQWYRATIPPVHTTTGAQVWTRFLRRQFSTLRRVSQLMHRCTTQSFRFIVYSLSIDY